MDAKLARVCADHAAREAGNGRIIVGVPLGTGSHHTVALLRRGSDGGYAEAWRESYPTRIGELEVETEVGAILYQKTTSPSSAEVLERYGVVLGELRVDWGSDADWVVDFGPSGDVTRRGLRSPTSSLRMHRGRITSPEGEEVVGGAAEGTRGTSLGSS